MRDARNYYRENAVQGASRVGLVVLLYEQMIEDLRRAIEALEKKQIEARTRRINHAILVIGYLQGTLNREQGGQVTRNLELFYNALRAKLVEAQARASKEMLNTEIENLLSLRDAWIQVEREQAAATGESGNVSGGNRGSASGARTGWRG